MGNDRPDKEGGIGRLVESFVIRRISSFIRHHRNHLLFGLTILSLASLLTWWSVFIERSILERRELRYEIITAEMRIQALELDKKPVAELKPGILAEDGRFEIAGCGQAGGRFSIPLRSLSGFCLRPRGGILDQIDSKTNSLKVMLIGEASLLALIVLVCIFFLYRNIQLERRSLREVREFWQRTAHEIKTPITGIKSFLQNLKGQPESMGEMARYVDLALNQVDRQEKLAENILSGYRLDRGISELRMGSLDLNQYLDDYFHQDALHLFGAKLNLRFGPQSELRVRGDSRALKVILDNITLNARKYGNSPLVLSVNVFREKADAIISFEDNGPGFDPRLSEYLFEAFKHSDRELPGSGHGTGLGLYISRRLARAMGGDLQASSQGPGKGARFCLRLKVHRNG